MSLRKLCLIRLDAGGGSSSFMSTLREVIPVNFYNKIFNIQVSQKSSPMCLFLPISHKRLRILI